MRSLLLLALAGLVPVAAHGQRPTESGAFIVRRGEDTIAIERFNRYEAAIVSVLYIRFRDTVTEKVSAVVDTTQLIPLVEVAVYKNRDTLNTSPHQRARVIFKDDSVAVDAMTTTGIQTLLFAPGAGAMPYLNLSFALLEQVVRRGRKVGGASGSIPFFNLGGGQTLVGTLTFGDGSARLQLADVPIDFVIDDEGRIRSAAITPQGVTVERLPGD